MQLFLRSNRLLLRWKNTPQPLHAQVSDQVGIYDLWVVSIFYKIYLFFDKVLLCSLDLPQTDNSSKLTQ